MIVTKGGYQPGACEDWVLGGVPITIYLSDVGGPIRTLFGMAHRHVFAINRDPKTGWPNPTEGMTERAWCMRCATDPDVVDYQTQPMRLEYMSGNTLVSWLPDYWILWRSGLIEVGEVKVDEDGLADPFYQGKLRAGFSLLARLGWQGRVRYSKEILGTPDRQVNVGTLYPDRSATIEHCHRAAFHRLVRQDAHLSFGGLVAELDPDRPMQAQAVAHRLICMGRVHVDLDELLTEDSPVTLRTRSHAVSPFRVRA